MAHNNQNRNKKIPATKIYFPDEDRKILLEQINEILKSGWLTLGNKTKELEDKFSNYTGMKYGIAVNSGTAALEIILRCLDVEGANIIIPTNTFAATAFAVLHAGAKVTFIDIEDDLSLNPEDLNAIIQKNTKVVILVHIGGIISKRIEEILKVCRDNDLYLIEDAAHALGSTFMGKRAGSFGTASAMSFYPTKVITSAEGGIIFTNKEEIFKRAIIFRDQGKASFSGNVHTELGYNWRMSEVHAVIGLSQFGRLEEFIKDRRSIATIYNEKLKDIEGIKPLLIPNEIRSNYYKYIAILDNDISRKDFKKVLKQQFNVNLSGEVYELPLHLQPIFKKIYGHKKGDFPNAEDMCKRHVCLPVYPTMTADDADYVMESIREVIR